MKRTLLFSLFVALLIAGCGGVGGPGGTPFPTPTLIPTYDYVSPTPFLVISTTVPATEAPASGTESAAAATETPAAGVDPTDVALGASRYTALTCDTCHGANGEGTSNGPKIAGLTMSEDDFLSVLRSGGKLGAKHIFRVSDTGAENLYLYLKSLPS